MEKRGRGKEARAKGRHSLPAREKEKGKEKNRAEVDFSVDNEEKASDHSPFPQGRKKGSGKRSA